MRIKELQQRKVLGDTVTPLVDIRGGGGGGGGGGA